MIRGNTGQQQTCVFRTAFDVFDSVSGVSALILSEAEEEDLSDDLPAREISQLERYPQAEAAPRPKNIGYEECPRGIAAR